LASDLEGKAVIEKPEIVYHQFGYSMTLYSFYQIIRKTPKQWVLREVEKSSRAGDYHENYFVKGIPNHFRPGSKEFRKTAGTYRIWNGEELSEDRND
jgi:hypothetical protein